MLGYSVYIIFIVNIFEFKILTSYKSEAFRKVHLYEFKNNLYIIEIFSTFKNDFGNYNVFPYVQGPAMYIFI